MRNWAASLALLLTGFVLPQSLLVRVDEVIE